MSRLHSAQETSWLRQEGEEGSTPGSTPGRTPRPGNPITLTGDLASISMPGDAGGDVPTHTLTFDTSSDEDEVAGSCFTPSSAPVELRYSPQCRCDGCCFRLSRSRMTERADKPREHRERGI